MSFVLSPSLSRTLDLTRVVKIVDAFSDAVHAHAPQSRFYLDQAHHLSGRMRTLEKRITDWDSHMILESGSVTISDEEFLELEEETRSIRKAAKGIHDYFYYHLPHIQAEGPSSPSRQWGSQGSTFTLWIGSGPSSSNGYQSATAPLNSSHRQCNSATSYGWRSPRAGRVNTPSYHSDVTSPPSAHWTLPDNENGSVKNYAESEEGASSGSIFSCANDYASRARARSDTPTPSLGQSSKSSYHTAFSQPFNGK